MKILLIEDNQVKRESIESFINKELSPTVNYPSITFAKDLRQALRDLITKQFDLIVFDMFLPEVYESGSERDCSSELITEFSLSKNYQSEAIALTQFEVSEIEDIQSFNRAGITLVNYNEKETWQIALKQKIIKASSKLKCDFIIFCALTKERLAYSDVLDEYGAARNICGMDCTEVKIDNQNGFIIKPQGMGLVNMAIISSKAIEVFQPKIVAMSGICAGVKGESKYLDIIVAQNCWEYQTGKWKDGKFQQEPYQVSLARNLLVDLNQSSENKSVLEEVRSGLFATELGEMKVKVAPISSGSAVIADQKMMEKIGVQQRKMAGLEMEMYSLYEAAAQSLCAPLFFGAKAVVDMGDSSKGDSLHEIGCTISARYVSLILRQQLAKIP